MFLGHSRPLLCELAVAPPLLLLPTSRLMDVVELMRSPAQLLLANPSSAVRMPHMDLSPSFSFVGFLL